MDDHDAVKGTELAILPEAGGILHPAVALLLEKNPTPEALGKIFEIQRQYEKDQAFKAYAQAKVDLKKALPLWIDRDKTVGYEGKREGSGQVKYKHTSLSHMMEVVQPHLSEFGFDLSWKPGTSAAGKVTVKAILAHRLGHSESAEIEAPPEMGGNKSAPQGVASTITLLERYTGLALLGIATRDMEEPIPEGATTTDAGKIDSAKNLRALPDLQKAGKSKADCEKYVGKPIQQWNAEDLTKLRNWIKPPPPPPEDREPGGDLEDAPPPPTQELDVPIGKKELDKIDALKKEFTLGPVAFADLAESELRRRATNKDLTLREFGVLEECFDKVRQGHWEIRDKKFVRPPEDEAKF